MTFDVPANSVVEFTFASDLDGNEPDPEDPSKRGEPVSVPISGTRAVVYMDRGIYSITRNGGAPVSKTIDADFGDDGPIELS